MKLSLVTCPVAMTAAMGEDEEARFHVLNRRTVRAYARGEDDDVPLEDAELESIELEGASTIDIQSFVGADSVDWIWYDAPYFLTPDDLSARRPIAPFATRCARPQW